MSHPFFASSLPAINLGPSSPIGEETQFPHTTKVNPSRPPMLPSKPIPRKVYPNLAPSQKPRRMTLGDIRNNDLRNVLCKELSSKAISSTRRVASNPLPRCDSHSPDSRALISTSIPVRDASSLSDDRPLEPLSFRHPTPSPSSIDIGSDRTRVSPRYPLHASTSQKIPPTRYLLKPAHCPINKIKEDPADILVVRWIY